MCVLQEILSLNLTDFRKYEILIIMDMLKINKYEGVHNWTMNELNSSIDNDRLPEPIKIHLRMLREAILYNLSKFED